jgi:type I restriction enzyme S subunit
MSTNIKVKLGNVARECRQTWNGSQQDVPIVGLEHLEPGEIELKAWDSNIEHTFSKKFCKGQVLLGRRRVYLRKAVVAPCDGICSGDITIIEALDGILPELLPFVIQNDRFFDYATKGSAGSLSPRVKWDYLANYEFDLPPIEEQKKLADKLWAAYRLKESYKKLLAATEEMVKSQFIEMFKGDFPKLSWEECLTIINGKKYDDDYQESGTYPICGSGGIMGYGERMLCPKDTVILGRKGNINSPIYMETDYWIVDTAFCLDVDRTKLHPKYFYFWCKLFDFTRYNKQGVLPSLTKNDLLKIEMPIPPMELQTKFVDIIEQADKSEFELRKSIDAIDAVIKSLINS